MTHSRRRRNPPSALTTALNAPCNFPRCLCGEKADRVLDALSRPERLLPDDIAWAREALICVLSCAEAHAINPHMRRHAMLQLIHPVFSGGGRAWLN